MDSNCRFIRDISRSVEDGQTNLIGMAVLSKGFWRICVIGLLVSVSACVRVDSNFEKRLEELETRERANRAKLNALVPLAGVPTQNQKGQPQVFEKFERTDSEEVSNGNCPSSSVARVRAESGADCATYQAEISSLVERCVSNCDQASIAIRTVQLGAARCSQFCTDKGCGARVTFIPPPQGCSETFCDKTLSECPDRRCPKFENCSLIHINRVWNCFCGDLIEN